MYISVSVFTCKRSGGVCVSMSACLCVCVLVTFRRKLTMSIWERCCMRPTHTNTQNEQNYTKWTEMVLKPSCALINQVILRSCTIENRHKQIYIAQWSEAWEIGLLIINQMQSKLLQAYWIARACNKIILLAIHYIALANEYKRNRESERERESFFICFEHRQMLQIFIVTC